MATENPHPRVGVAAIIYSPDGKVVAGKRLGSHGAGTWQLPGGHLEYGEDVLVCAEREALEETGLEVRGVKIGAVTNTVFHEDRKHYITLFVLCEMRDKHAQPQVLEPEKCEGWHWKSWDDLKRFINPHLQGAGLEGEKLFLPLERLLENRKSFEDLKLDQ
ncbi:NUDIX hydrolase domain-like protein [Mariannaea sp. PMI_226]|nr:NUDIX hydrolase domain-like protein [Mariannaea sp. PMI_226]